MAKKKNPENIEDPSMLSNPESETPTDETPSEVNTENEVEEPQRQLEIPANVLKFMERHPELKGIYVDKLGGTYPEDIDQAFVKDAMLYQNPYFKQ